MGFITEDWLPRLLCMGFGFYVGVLLMAIMISGSRADEWVERQFAARKRDDEETGE